MKITKYVSALLLSLFIITSCTDENITDIDISDSAKLESRQWTVDFMPFDPCAGPVTVYVPPCFVGTGYEEAIPVSLDMIMDVSSIEFVIVNNPNADLTFECRPGGGICGTGFAYFPTDDGTIGGPVRLTIDPVSCPCDPSDLDLCFYVRTAVHEVMHALGVLHNERTYIGVHVPGTPYGYESGSVMNNGGQIYLSGQWCLPSCTLTENDIAAIDFLYPSCNPCENECPTIEATQNLDSDGCCQWTVEFETNSSCQYFYDIRNPPAFNSTTGNVIPNGNFNFETETICCGGGSIVISVYGIDANGPRFECESLELVCCVQDAVPCGVCPESVLTKHEDNNGCAYWDGLLTNFSTCVFYFDINNPAPYNSSRGNILPIGVPVPVTTNTVCCKEGPIIINTYTIGQNGEKLFCPPIVLSACEDKCSEREDCFEIGFQEGYECRLVPLLRECGLESTDVATYKWLLPSGEVSNGLSVDALEDGAYCLTIILKNDCVITDCIVVDGCKGGTGVSVGN